MMIVANVAVALSPSCRASRYGRITSPARAGRTALAANPIVVVRNAAAKRAWPIGASRYCHRIARSTMRHHGDGRRERNQPRIRLLHLRPDDVEMGAAKEKREQADREHDDDNGAKRFLHVSACIRDEKRASTIRGVAGNAKNALVVVARSCSCHVPDKIGALRHSIEVSYCLRRRQFSKQPSTV